MLRTSVEPFNFFRAQLPPEKIVSVLEHINEGCGVVRKTERLVGVHRDTITRYSRLAGEHDALRAHDDELLVALFPSKTKEVQFDEKCSFVAKKEKHRDHSDPADDHKGE
jgi:hypothetical protein